MMDEFEVWYHHKWTGKKCVVCFNRLSHATEVCQLCSEQIEFCNDCRGEDPQACGNVLAAHLEKNHGPIDLC